MTIPLRVLVVEDNEDDAVLLLRALRLGGYAPESVRVETSADMKAALREHEWDLIVSDYVMPHFSGLAALRLVQESGLDIPFIVVSGSIGEETAVYAMKAGAHDYIMKENLVRLVPAVERELGDAEARLERRVAEDARRQTEVHYQALVERVPAITYVAHLDDLSSTAYVSPQIVSILGYSQTEVMKDAATWFRIIHPDDRARVAEGLARTRETGEPFVCEYRAFRRDGAMVWLQDQASVIRGEDGGESMLQGIVFDVTARRAEDERRRVTGSLLELFARKSSRKEYLDSVVQLIRDWSGCCCVGIRVADGSGFIPYESMTGFSREFRERENMLSLERDTCACIRVIRGVVEAQDARVMTAGGSFRCEDCGEFLATLTEEEKRRFRGTCMQAGFHSLAVIPVRYRGRPLGAVHLADERAGMAPLEMVEFIESMTPLIGEAVHRFSTEQALAESNALLERVFENTHVAIAYLDCDMNFIRVNRAYARSAYKSEDFFVGLNHFDLYPHEENERIFRSVVETGAPHFVTAKPFAYPDQSEHGVTYWDWSLLPVRDESGAVEGLVLCLLDVTERTRAEERVLAYQEQLRALALQLSLTEQRERRQLATMLHDSIGQALALAKMKLGGVRQAVYATPLAKSVDDVNNLVQQSIQHTRSLIFELSPPHLYEYGLESALAQLAENIEEQHEIAVEFEDDGSAKPLDEDVCVLLFQAVRELLINVVKHANATRVRLSVMRESARIHVRVQDDGAGFEPPPSGFTVRKDGGFGLFNICERLDHLKGEFRVESRPGSGTTAALVAPLKSEGDGDGHSGNTDG